MVCFSFVHMIKCRFVVRLKQMCLGCEFRIVSVGKGWENMAGCDIMEAEEEEEIYDTGNHA